MLDQQLLVVSQWLAPDASGTPLGELVLAENGRLPSYLDRCVRRLTAHWNFERPITCTGDSADPLPNLRLRVAALTGQRVCVGVFLDAYREIPRSENAAERFGISPREREVLRELLHGHSVAEIAAALNLAVSTVNDHIARLISKTNARNRIEMAARLLGWSPDEVDVVANRPGRALADLHAVGSSLPADEPPARCAWQYTIDDPAEGERAG